MITIKHGIIVLAIGFCIVTMGALQKILHTAYADTLLQAGILLEIAGALLIVFKLINKPKHSRK